MEWHLPSIPSRPPPRAPAFTCHRAASTSTHHAIHRTRETAGRGHRSVLRAIIAISRCDPMPPPCPVDPGEPGDTTDMGRTRLAPEDMHNAP